MPSAGFEPAISANQAATDLRFRRHGHLDRLRSNNSWHKNHAEMQVTSKMHEDKKFIFRNSNIHEMIQKQYFAYINLQFLK